MHLATEKRFDSQQGALIETITAGMVAALVEQLGSGVDHFLQRVAQNLVVVFWRGWGLVLALAGSITSKPASATVSPLLIQFIGCSMLKTQKSSRDNRRDGQPRKEQFS